MRYQDLMLILSLFAVIIAVAAAENPFDPVR